jgi:SPP1 gp7 family putative phage head morphogenesis protein
MPLKIAATPPSPPGGGAGGEGLSPSEFAALFRLPAQEAVDYLQRRGKLTKTFDWRDLWQDEHAQQFTVSRLARLDLLEAIRDGITKSVQGDLSRRDWTRDIKSLLQQSGWWGEKNVLDPDTGELVKTVFDPARLKLIYDTNTNMAYSAGLWERIERNKKTSPYIRYITKRDERVRELHEQWDNVALPVDDPWWNTHYPPNGWRCRCRAMSMSQKAYDDAVKKGWIKTQAPAIKTRPWTNKRTGEVMDVPAGIDPGFAYNPGKAGQRKKELGRLATAKLGDMPAPMRRAALSPSVVGDVGDSFQMAVTETLDVLPDPLRNTVFGHGYEVVIARRLVDVKPELESVTPRGYPSGHTWLHSDGGTIDGKFIVVAETSVDPLTGETVFTTTQRAGALLRHEFAHALDAARNLSATAAFRSAYALDAKDLRVWLPKLGDENRLELEYFLQPRNAGPEELFSELFAEHFGGGAAESINTALAFPRAYAEFVRLITLPKE